MNNEVIQKEENKEEDNKVQEQILEKIKVMKKTLLESAKKNSEQFLASDEKYSKK